MAGWWEARSELVEVCVQSCVVGTPEFRTAGGPGSVPMHFHVCGEVDARKFGTGNDLPPLNWSARIVRERRIRYGNQTTQA